MGPIVRGANPQWREDFGVSEGWFSPPAPSDAFPRWLYLRMPPGAPTLPISPEAREDPTRYRPHPGSVPKVVGPPRALFTDKRQVEEREAVGSVAPGKHRQLGTHAPREGLPAWSIEAARDHDLRGKSYIEIAKGLEYDDWQFAHPERSRATEQRVS